jgi:predicted Zn-dependent protease
VVSQPAGPRPLTAEERDGMSRVRKVLAGESKVKDLRQAFDIARGVADAHPESVEAQHLAAEAAYRVSRWADAARYFQRGGEPPADQPELLFYMAVALYESGDQARAAEILKRSLPNLQRTPYVDSYARKILG